MQRLEVSGAVRPLKWSLGVRWLISVALLGSDVTQKPRCIVTMETAVLLVQQRYYVR